MNKFVGYITRSYEQFTNSIIDKIKDEVPEITDYSDSNPFIFNIRIFGGILEYMSYIMDRIAQNSFLSTTNRFDVAVKKAIESDYRVKGRVPATCEIVFTLDGLAIADVTIPTNTEVSSKKGISFFTSSQVQILTGSDTVSVTAEQKIEIDEIIIGSGDGTKNQNFVIEDDGISDSLVFLKVDGISWIPVDTFAYSLPTDQHYQARQNENKEFTIVFSDGINGQIPQSGEQVTCSYSVTEGNEGNLSANEITDIVDTISVSGGLNLTVSNPTSANGGSNEDDLDTLRTKIPAHRFTLESAVDEESYKSLAVLVAGVSQVGASKKSCGNVEIYVSPIGGGIATSLLLERVEDFIRPKGILGIEINAVSAGQLRVSLGISLRLKKNASKEEGITQVIDSLVEFGSESNQQVGGNLNIGDIYEVIENLSTVSSSEIDIFASIPYARPIQHEQELLWERITLSNANSTVQYKIIMQSAVLFAIFEDNAFKGSFNVGDVVELDNVKFMVNSSTYTVNMIWEFIVYPYNKSIINIEDSIPTILSTDIDFIKIQ